MRIRPVNGRMICVPAKEDEKTPGGIVLPSSMVKNKGERAEVGIIVAIDLTEEHRLNKELQLAQRCFSINLRP